jgi:glucuronokinase
MIIQKKAYARAGLIGNPSDGYFGKTISFVVRNFWAEVVLYESPEVEILPNQRDQSQFESIEGVVSDVKLHGYYGGVRLLKATIKRFHDYCVGQGVRLDDRNFTIRYESNIPSRVGLAGSSAIVTAGLRALMTFYGVEIPKPEQANLILAVEAEELKIPAGLQDRVIQVYEGLVYMDFNKELMARRGYGCYEALDPALLPPLYVAYRTRLSEGTEVFHDNIRERFNRGEEKVVAAMQYWAGLAEECRACLLQRDWARVAELMNRNFDKRREIYEISRGNVEMVEAARAVGASAKFTGSGGAIVGTYQDEAMYRRLQEQLAGIGVEVLKPEILPELEKVQP